jgi:hypothetical protein
MTRGWRSQHNEEIPNLYSSRNIIRAMRTMKIRRAGYVANMNLAAEINQMFLNDHKTTSFFCLHVRDRH